MVNLKRDNADTGMDYTPSQYPGGLCLYLDEDTCEKLGIPGALTPGTVIGITAQAIVTNATESLEADGDDKGNDVSMSLQITDLSLVAGGVASNAAEELYGKATRAQSPA